MRYGIPDDPTKEDIFRVLADESIWVCRHEFEQMSNYSCSVPTGVYVGKFWKCRRDYYDEGKGWVLGEYVAHPTEKNMAYVRWSGLMVSEHYSQLAFEDARYEWMKKENWKMSAGICKIAHRRRNP